MLQLSSRYSMVKKYDFYYQFDNLLMMFFHISETNYMLLPLSAILPPAKSAPQFCASRYTPETMSTHLDLFNFIRDDDHGEGGHDREG